MAHVATVEGAALTRAVGNIGQGPLLLPGVDANLHVDLTILSKHLLFIGSIGSGKSNAMYLAVSAIKDQMGKDDVMVIFDPKGDYLQRFYASGDVVLANSIDAGAVRWNVFKDIQAEGPEHQDEAVYEIARTLFHERIKNSNQPFFPQAASDIVAAVLLAMVRNGEPKTNMDFRQFFDRSGTEEVRAFLEPHVDLRGTSHYIANDKSPQTQGVMSEAQQALRETFIGSFREPGDFSIREFVRNKGGRAVFIEYDIATGSTLAPVYRLLIDLAIKEALSRRRTAGNVFFVLDEFPLLPNLSHVDNGINFGRSLGVKFLVGTQNIGQILEAYGEGRGTSILSGFGTVISSRLFDANTRSYVMNRHGANRKQIAVPSVIGSRGVVEQVLYGSVIEDWDLSDLNVGEAVVSLPTGPPVKFRFAQYQGGIVNGSADGWRGFSGDWVANGQ